MQAAALHFSLAHRERSVLSYSSSASDLVHNSRLIFYLDKKRIINYPSVLLIFAAVAPSCLYLL